MRPQGRSTTAERLRERVRKGYAAAVAESTCAEIARRIGYTPEQLARIPSGCNFGFGCGNPVALAQLKSGEAVLDLGCGAGADVFLAAGAVGTDGRAVGVDLTPHMLDQARAATRLGEHAPAEFHEAPIEELPFEDASMDAVISNGVINLSPERDRALKEAHRVLRSGGRLVISDLTVEAEIDPAVARTAQLYLGTLLTAADYATRILEAGFRDVEILREIDYGRLILSRSQEFRRAAEEDAVPSDRLQSFFENLRSFELRARK